MTCSFLQLDNASGMLLISCLCILLKFIYLWFYAGLYIVAFFIWSMVKQFYNKNIAKDSADNKKCNKCACRSVCCVCRTLLYIISYTFSFILLYLTALNSLKRSPGSQLLEWTFGLLPPVLGTVLGFVLRGVDQMLKEQTRKAQVTNQKNRLE